MSWLGLVRHSPALRSALARSLALKHRRTERLRRSAEQALDRLAQLSPDDVTLFVPEFEARFALSPRSALFRRILIDGEYEPQLVRAFRQHFDPQLDTLDIGANVGFFTVLAAGLVTTGRVLAAEPSRTAAVRLRHNLTLNAVTEKVILFEGLLSDHVGERTLNVIPGREEYSSMGPLVHPSVAGQAFVQETAAATTVDNLVERHQLRPGLIKLDVEGAEALVLAGATRTLREHRPVILSELSNALLRNMGSSGTDVVAKLKGLGYQVTDLKDPTLPPGVRLYGDILAVPKRST
jgi:FkbM family methyltransferase